MRPLGDVARAIERAACTPGTVVQLAHRAQVGVQVAKYTASRMIDRQQLVVVEEGRPAVLVAAGSAVARAADVQPQKPARPCRDEQLAGALDLLTRSFWERDPDAPP